MIQQSHFLVLCTVLLLVASVLPAQTDDTFTDEQVSQAISKAVEWLWSQQRPDGHWEAYGTSGQGHYYPTGPSCIVMYALMESGVSPQDPRMAKALDWLTKNYEKDYMTYSIGLRCHVWRVANRETRGKYTTQLKADIDRLVRSTGDGSYKYECLVPDHGDPGTNGDNSTSQYGLLGVWAGKEAGLEEIPRAYWYRVMRHWLDTQQGDGGWTYLPGMRTRRTMVAAGVASLFVCFDSLFYDAFKRCNVDRSAEMAAINRGLDWFDRNFEATLGEGSHFFYYMYGVERVGLASGYKYFGKTDWYKVGTARMLRMQRPEGNFARVYQTAYALLYLVRGRQPILFNKLEFDADWNNRPRDLAMLTRWISKQFEATVNWQIITLKAPVSEWHDAPILYLSASRAPEMTDEHIAKLREFVLQGGTLFSCTECHGSQFSKGIRDVYARVFPEYELKEVPEDHELYNIHFRMSDRDKKRLKFQWMTNGVRPLVIHTDEDVSLQWQTNKSATEAWAFQAAANVYFYCTDKGSLRNRGVKHWPDEPKIQSPKGTVTIARLKHPGQFNPEPLALQRFARLMGERQSIRVELPAEPLAIDQLKADAADIAALTGVGKLMLSDGEKQALKSYVENGGTLLIDAAGGSSEFGKDATALVEELFGIEATDRLPVDNPIYTVAKTPISKVVYRRQSARKHPSGGPVLRGKISDGGRPMVVLSEEDITAGLVGYPSYTIEGYAPESAFDLMRNLVFAVTQAKSGKQTAQAK